MVKFTRIRAPPYGSPDWEYIGAGSRIRPIKQFTVVNGIPESYIRLSLPIGKGLFTGSTGGPGLMVLGGGWMIGIPWPGRGRAHGAAGWW